MEILLLTVGKTRNKIIIDGIDDYLKRLRRYVAFSIVEIPDVKSTKSTAESLQKLREGEEILSRIDSSDIVVLLDERGREYTSMEFATYIEKLMASGRKRLIFVVGGPYGFSEQVYKRANNMLSLSKMTFNHEMVRLFFVEQLYRAQTILRNEPYHHQ